MIPRSCALLGNGHMVPTIREQRKPTNTAKIEPLFGNVRCPVKIVWGKDDPWIPLERGNALHALIQQASFENCLTSAICRSSEAPDVVLGRPMIAILTCSPKHGISTAARCLQTSFSRALHKALE